MSADLAAIQEQYGVTKKEAMLMAVLLDGQTHDKSDLRAKAFNGQHSSGHLIPMHIYRMKPKLRARGIILFGVGRPPKFLGWKIRFSPSEKSTPRIED